mgnify:CR=1 FL=1|tara:strand:+ start:7735 stop:15936 length:8202 start_codon:yes stop_codon:yes gene_type:complete
MAKRRRNQSRRQRKARMQNTMQTDTDVFLKGMSKDPNAALTDKNNWTHARNAINNSSKGDVGAIGNEPANLFCVEITYTVIGTIHLYGDKWVIYSTDDINSEIGIFDDSQCTYETLVNDGASTECPPGNCLNFNRLCLITGASKENFDCTWQVYWDDGRNPSRTMNITNIPWKTEKVVDIENTDCIQYVPIEPLQIDCDLLRLAPLMDTPEVILSSSDNGGQLRNGSYQAFIAYTINQQQIGDYIGVSNVQSLWDHEDVSGSLDIKLGNLDRGGLFEEFKLVILSNNQNEVVAKHMGFYSVETTHIGIDYIDRSLKSVPIELLPLRNPVYERSDKMYVVNDYLIRSGPYERFDFNYQPLANQIETTWMSTKFPADYYKKGGNKPTFMRDEVYAFFIRWIYNTGEKSSSYHIPGRGPEFYAPPMGAVTDLTPAGDNNNLDVGEEMVFQSYNTARYAVDGPFSLPNYRTNDGGIIFEEGYMAYWQSTERYPMDPVRWGDLCGKYIRHHKMPDEQSTLNGSLHRATNNNQTIQVLGVKFKNIALPRLNPETVGVCEDPQGEGALVPGIVGYEILVGSRKGNKSIIAKGLARNMKGYRLPPDAVGNDSTESIANDTIGVMANYPFNDLGCDAFLHDPGDVPDDDIPSFAYPSRNNANPYQGLGVDPVNIGDRQWKFVYKNMFTFHSPDTSINQPFLSPYEIKSYGITTGQSIGRFKVSEKHPQQKLLTNISAFIAIIIGVGYAIGRTRGKRQITVDYPQPMVTANPPLLGTGISGGNLLALYGQQGVTAGTETVATASTVFGAPGIGQQLAQAGNTAGFALTTQGMVGGYQDGGVQVNYDRGEAWFGDLPAVLQPLYGVFAFINMTAEGGNHIINLIYELCSFQDYAMKYNGHGLYWRTELQYLDGDGDKGGVNTPMRTRCRKARYVKNTMQNLTSTIKINNLFRPNTVALVGEGYEGLGEPDGDPIEGPNAKMLGYIAPGADGFDDSRKTIGQEGNTTYPTRPFTRNIAAQYVGLKVQFENQYGQLDQVKQVPITNGEFGTGIQYVKNQLPSIEGGYAGDDITLIANIDTRLKSDTLYGGDCYINRYTEKNIMPFYWDFLLGQPDGFPYDYRLRANVMFPMYWANFIRYDLSNLARYITNFAWLDTPSELYGAMPNGFFHLDDGSVQCEAFTIGGVDKTENMTGIIYPDGDPGLLTANWAFDGSTASGGDMEEILDDDGNVIGYEGGGDGADGGIITLGGLEETNPYGSVQPIDSGPYDVNDETHDKRGKSFFHIKDRYFYTHVNGIQDFWVESEINVAQRDYEDQKGKRHYDWLEYADINDLFHAEIISIGNFYKYDNSLTYANFPTTRINSGLLQPRDYDPFVAETCNTHYPKRLAYSLQAQNEAKKDFWRVFLPNNYKDFKNQVNVIKPISKSGAVILFPHLAPALFQGVDTLRTDLGTKLTIGDGGLFSQPMQNLVNADLPHEYGSCESARSVINTPAGMFYISQAQGKIFHMAGKGLNNISNLGMKQWFNQYLPSQLIKQFPELETCPKWSDNPVAGVGCQSVYDPNYDLVYFMKKDFSCTSDCIEFNACDGFVYNQTKCDGLPQIECCPEGFTYVGNGKCERVYYVDADITESTTITKPQFDIMLSVQVTRNAYVEDNVAVLQALLLNIINSFGEQLADGDVQIAIRTFDTSGKYIQPFTDDFGQLTWWANNVVFPSTQTGLEEYLIPLSEDDLIAYEAVDVGISGGSNNTKGFWESLDYLYTNGRAGVNKVHVQIDDRYDTTAMPSHLGDGYGYDSGASTATPTTTPMVNTLSINPGEPGDLSFYQENQWGIDIDNLPEGPAQSYLPYAEVAQITSSYNDLEQNDSFITWLNNNIFDPTSNYQNEDALAFNGQLQVWAFHFEAKIAHPSMLNPDGTFPELLSDYPTVVEPTQGNIDYTAARSGPGPNQWGIGGYNMEVANNMAVQLFEGVTTTTEIVECPPECEPIQDANNNWTCECLEMTAPLGLIDQTIPVALDDTSYFEDVSWTVSYDPKAKAWISFHDWHPELVLPSLNHFLTTKSKITEDPLCPPGFNFNPTTGQCEQFLAGEFPATIQVEERQGNFDDNVSSETAACPYDIVLAVDASGSTATNGDAAWKAELQFMDKFVEELEAEITSGAVQIAIVQWAGIPQVGRELDVTSSNRKHLRFTNSYSSIRNFIGIGPGFTGLGELDQAFDYYQQGTRYSGAVNSARVYADDPFEYPDASVVNAQGLSHSGSRFDNPNLKRVAIIITDALGYTNNVVFEDDCAIDNGVGTGPTLNAMLWRTGELGLHEAVSSFAPPACIPSDTVNLQFANHIAVTQGLTPGEDPFVDCFAALGQAHMNIDVIAVKAGQEEDDEYIWSIYKFQKIYYDLDYWWWDQSWFETDYAGATLANPRSAYQVYPGAFAQPAIDVVASLDCTYRVDGENICDCDNEPGFEIVYQDESGYFASPVGQCNPGSFICRRVDCFCDDSNVSPETVITEQGDCPDFYLLGDPGYYQDYLNGDMEPFPKSCLFDGVCQVPPSYLRGGTWKHNVRCDLYTNYYDEDYPWEIEWVEAIGQQVNTVKSIEYQLESWIYKGNLDNNCGDRFHDLDFNFDEAIVHNSEQVSGLLTLDLNPKNDVPLITNYPIVTANDIRILYSKEEQKFRFNQFWDITYDRGEFSDATESIFITQLNGYIRDLNEANLNYNKDQLQRKKFRHYYNKILLRRTVSGDRKMVLKLANTKVNYSFR